MTALDTSSQAAVRLLPSHVIDQIAAGEVIERPASVVKELLENALDAGGQRLRVTLEGGGLERILVEDDGKGMSPEDARLCIQRHATSKLRHVADLDGLGTLGFRGEALSSIAGISHFTLTTRRPDDEVGIRVRVEGGQNVSWEAVGCPVGTSVDVRDLFFNTPARKKFMRTSTTEQSHVVEAVLRVLLGVPRVGVVVQAKGRRLLDIPEGVSEDKRVLAALGRRVERIYPFCEATGGIVVEGYVTDPALSRGDSKGLWIFVNGRFVRDRMLQRAALEACARAGGTGRYPVALLRVEVSPDTVDVNVHPQKLEVRFSDAQAVFRAVHSALTVAYQAAPWAEQAGGTVGGAQGVLRQALVSASSRAEPMAQAPESVPVAAPQRDWPLTLVQRQTSTLPSERPRTETLSAIRVEDEVGSDVPTLSERDDAPTAALPLWRSQAERSGAFTACTPLGLFQTRWALYDASDALVIFDVNAVCQRLALARLCAEYQRAGVVRETLVLPAIVAVDDAAATVLDRDGCGQRLAALGFRLDCIGPSRFAVRDVPRVLLGSDYGPLLERLAQELASTERCEDEGWAEVVFAKVASCASLSVIDLVVDEATTVAPARASVARGQSLERRLLRALDSMEWTLESPELAGTFSRWTTPGLETACEL